MEIHVTFTVDNDLMTDEEFENQEEKMFIITEDDIKQFIYEKSKDVKQGDDVDNIDFTVKY